MSTAKEELGHLLVLVAERQWTALARALSDLVLAWPETYPDAMRAPMLALLETALREADEAALRELAPRYAGHGTVPLKVVNLLYLAAPAPLRREILLRNAMDPAEQPSITAVDGTQILAAARQGARDFLAAFATAAGLPRKTAQAILSDETGEALAVFCRGAGLERATFSAIALLKGPRGMPLSVFDTVAPKAAAHLVADWQKAATPQHHPHIQAAE